MFRAHDFKAVECTVMFNCCFFFVRQKLAEICHNGYMDALCFLREKGEIFPPSFSLAFLVYTIKLHQNMLSTNRLRSAYSTKYSQQCSGRSQISLL